MPSDLTISCASSRRLLKLRSSKESQMVQIFSELSSWLVFDLMNLEPNTQITDTLLFFVEKIAMIFSLLLATSYAIGCIRPQFTLRNMVNNVNRKHRFVGYFLASRFSITTSLYVLSLHSIVKYFISAGVSTGILITFLSSLILINDMSIVLMLSLLGWKFTAIYMCIAILFSIGLGAFLDVIDCMENNQVINFKQKNTKLYYYSINPKKMTPVAKMTFAKIYTLKVLGKLWVWIIIGSLIGAILYGLIPDDSVRRYLDADQWWSVPFTLLLGISLPCNLTAMLPIVDGLHANSLPLGNTIAFLLASVLVPVFIVLKKIMHWHYLVVFLSVQLMIITTIGWVFNGISFKI